MPTTSPWLPMPGRAELGVVSDGSGRCGRPEPNATALGGAVVEPHERCVVDDEGERDGERPSAAAAPDVRRCALGDAWGSFGPALEARWGAVAAVTAAGVAAPRGDGDACLRSDCANALHHAELVEPSRTTSMEAGEGALDFLSRRSDDETVSVACSPCSRFSLVPRGPGEGRLRGDGAASARPSAPRP